MSATPLDLGWQHRAIAMVTERLDVLARELADVKSRLAKLEPKKKGKRSPRAKDPR